jgi:hypothetical protein
MSKPMTLAPSCDNRSTRAASLTWARASALRGQAFHRSAPARARQKVAHGPGEEAQVVGF